MKNILILLALVFSGLNAMGTLIPIPEELKIFDGLENWKRWVAFAIAVIGSAILKFHTHLTLKKIQRVLGIGISWDQQVHLLGFSSSSDSPTIRVHGVQYRGRNNRPTALTYVKAHLVYP